MKVIAIITNGFVFMGDVESDTPEKLVLDNASCVRVWGTRHGIGEIALYGPTKDTILDPCGAIHINKVALIATIPCTFKKK